MKSNKIQIAQLEHKFKRFSPLLNVATPPTGWIKAVRLALGMTLQQLANKLNVTKQSVLEMERREVEGSISLKTLRETANALDMDLVYGFVPKDGSLEKLIERKAMELATKIVKTTSNSMKLENQENSKQRIKSAIKERAATFTHEKPKMLWD